MTDNMIAWEKDADGIVVLTMDDPNQGANTMNELYTTSMAATVDRLEAEKDDITGVVITSAKKTFFAGGDLKDMTAERTQSKEEIAASITEPPPRATMPSAPLSSYRAKPATISGARGLTDMSVNDDTDSRSE